MLERMWSKGTTFPLLVGVQTCIITLEISMAVSKKFGNHPTSKPRNNNLEYIPKGCRVTPQGHMLNYLHSSIIQSSHNLETTEMPLNQKVDEQNVVYL